MAFLSHKIHEGECVRKEGLKENETRGKKQRDSVEGGLRILLKKGQTTTRHIAAASHTEGLKRMLAGVKQIRP